MFKNLKELSNALLEKLPVNSLLNSNTLLLALSKKSILITESLAKTLNLNYDILLQRSIYAPNSSSTTIAKVSETQDLVLHTNLIYSFEIDQNWIYSKAKEIYEKSLKNDIRKFRKGDKLTTVTNRDILLTGYVIEDGMSTLCAIKSLINLGAKSIILAVGIIPSNIYDNLNRKVDSIYFVKKEDDFVDKDHYFKIVEDYDEELIKYILDKSNNFRRKDEKN